MKKLLICKLASLFFGFLAVSVFAKLQTVALYLQHGDLLSAALALMSAIFGSQWIEYRQRMDNTPLAVKTGITQNQEFGLEIPVCAE